MDLTSLLLRAGAARPHVLVVAVAGGTGARLAVEAELTRRGWPLAITPADADLLVVAGIPGPALTPIIEEVWQQLPAPRSLITVGAPDQAATALDAGQSRLVDLDHQRSGSTGPAGTQPLVDHGGHSDSEAHGSRTAEPLGGGAHSGSGGHSGHDASHGQHPAETSDGGHSGHGPRDGQDSAGLPDGGAHSGHGAHGGHGGGMGMPGGLPMADLGADRDGLTLDRLHVPLGPLLPDWPAGLVVHAVLQGDVIQEATTEVLDGGDETSFWTGPDRAAARELDGLARFLGVAGWDDPAARARRLRDELLAGASPEHVAQLVGALTSRVRRSWTLRWLIRGIAAGPTDLTALLEQRLDAVHDSLAGHPRSPGARANVDALPAVLIGAEFATARLIIAAMDPQTEPVEAPQQVHHG